MKIFSELKKIRLSKVLREAGLNLETINGTIFYNNPTHKIAVSFLKHGVMQVHGKALNQFITPDMFTYQIVAPTVYHALIELWRLKALPFQYLKRGAEYLEKKYTFRDPNTPKEFYNGSILIHNDYGSKKEGEFYSSSNSSKIFPSCGA